ncbi:MAG: hypothetical protein ACK5NT_13210 [Pyrinomonadaceae bacterium]
MHITRIELEDIKSHKQFEQDFYKGTTAIVGENGTGKTTIIEAIGWTLFDLLDYKKDDFVRRGAKKGVAKVTFESSLDQRQYTVQRDTKTGYFVYDPKLSIRIADKKEEVQRFLWKHLGVDPGTDLESMYRRAIGVPQGTFTAIFLETPTSRKSAFDKLLKVEEYRTGADNLLETTRYVQGSIISSREAIARFEGELQRTEQLEQELNEATAQIEKISNDFASIEKVIATKTELLTALETSQKSVETAAAKTKEIENKRARAEIILNQKLSELEKADKAAKIVSETNKKAKIHEEAQTQLNLLEKERSTRDEIRHRLNTIEKNIATTEARKNSTIEELRKIEVARKKTKELSPDVIRQAEFEKELEALRSSLVTARSATAELASLEKQINTLRKRFRENKSQLAKAEEKSAEAEHLKTRQERADEIQINLAKLRAELARDKEFQKQARDGLCPILTAKCLNLKEGETLTGFLNSRFPVLTQEITTLEGEQTELSKKLKLSREAAQQSASLHTLRNNSDEIERDGKELRERAETLREQNQDISTTENEIEALQKQIALLDDPQGKSRILENQIQNEPNIKATREELEKQLSALENEHNLIEKELEKYSKLDTTWQEVSKKRDETADAHRQFIANEAIARSADELKNVVKVAKEEYEAISNELSSAEQSLKEKASSFDFDMLKTQREELLAAERELISAHTNREVFIKREQQIRKDLEGLNRVRASLKKQLEEKERLERIGEATEFIRATLKEAGPRVAKNYVFHVSVEANQIFRDITGNAERTLSWGEDYGINLEEEGKSRPFINLSGGEQMAAAMSVRLALLTQLSDIKVAFFDEPTMNMDTERRERLAEQIARINEKQTFDQLFVISHDDTFESYVDNTVVIEA